MGSTKDTLNHFPSLARLALRMARRRYIPVVKQLAVTDCGPAALAMVFAYFGKRIQLDELRRAIGLGRDGTTAASLLRVGRAYGMRGRGICVELADLDDLPRGAILHWEFNHFVVLERVRRKNVEIVDPASGRRLVTLDRFRRSFTGVALVFEPSESFWPEKSDHPRISGLFRQILGQRDLVARILISSLLVQLLSAVVPLFTGVLVDRVVPHKDYSLLLTLAVGYCIFQAFNVFSGFVRTHLLIHLRVRVEAYFTLSFLDHLLGLPYKFFQEHTAGDLMVRLGCNNTVREILTSTALSALLDGSVATIYLALLLVANVKLTIVVVILALARVFVLWMLRLKQRQFVGESLDNQSRSQTYEVEMLSGIETLKAMGLEHRAGENWSHVFVDGLNISIKQGRLEAVFNGLLNFLGIATSLVFLFYGSFLVLRGDLTLGMMMAFSALAAGFLGPVSNLVNAALQLQTIEVYVERLNDVMKTPLEQEQDNIINFSEPLAGAVALDRVSFRYSGQSALVIQDISVRLEPGARVAVVGRTGCGKSTVARLLAGLYCPSSGRILFDDKDLKNLDLRSIRSQLGIVTQDTQLFGGSIRRNIALTDHQMSLDRVVRAAKLAGMHDDIMAMPMGYETCLTDRGLSLSGGQRQRLAIARALARNPKILILDEATSHLDAATEEQINRNLSSLHCTQVVIAHRLSTIRNCDLILVLESGQIVEQGIHETLVRAKGVYADLVLCQREHEYSCK